MAEEVPATDICHLGEDTPVTAGQERIAHLALSSVMLSTFTVAKKSPELILPVGTLIFRDTALERATLCRSISIFSKAVVVGRLDTGGRLGGSAGTGDVTAAASFRGGRAGP